MPFTSLKVEAADKRAFDRLRHEVALHTGEELAQHELFHRIVQQALLQKGALLRAHRPAPAARWTRHQIDLGVATDVVQDLDRTVYGLDA